MPEVSYTNNDRYAVLREVAANVQEIRDRSREVRKKPFSKEEAVKQVRREIGKIQNVFASNPNIAQTVFYASGVSMSRLRVGLEADREDDATVSKLSLYVDGTASPVDEFGISQTPVRIKNGVVFAAEGEEGYVLDTKLVLAETKPTTIELSSSGISMGSIALARNIVFPAYSSDELVVPQLQDLAERKELYAILRNKCPDSGPFVKSVRRLERALCHEDPTKFTDLEELDIPYDIATSATVLIQRYPHHRDNILSLLKVIIGEDRQLLIKAEHTSALIDGKQCAITSEFMGRFVNIIDTDTGQIATVLRSDYNGSDIFVQVPLSEVTLFKF